MLPGFKPVFLKISHFNDFQLLINPPTTQSSLPCETAQCLSLSLFDYSHFIYNKMFK